jgi:tyrosyl-tRNA synthetase
MYRYYELLTDMPVSEIERLREQVAQGKRDPMEVKMALARQLVSDYHSASDAGAAFDAFNREVRQGLEPADTETVPLPPDVKNDKGIRIDKLLARLQLAPSVTEATRRVKEGAVEINGERVMDLVLTNPPALMVIRAGKKWKRVTSV